MPDVDQRGFDNQSDEFLEADAASTLLGIKRATLYAYASRGLVKSLPGEERRSRRYLRADLERLKARHDARSGHGAVAAGALRWGEPVLESALTGIDARGPRYRGELATDLVHRSASFEEVSELLWGGPPEASIRWPHVSFGVAPASVLSVLPPGTAAPATLALCTAILAAQDFDRFGATDEAERVRARSLIRRLAAALALTTQPGRLDAALGEPTVAKQIVRALGLKGGRSADRLVNAALVLCADHELNPSTFTARVAASSGADLYACVGAALATHSGPRHGGACDRIEALVGEVGRPENAQQAVRDRLRRGEAIPGFGHPLYPQGDPRAPPLLEAAQAHAGRSLRLRTLLAVTEAMQNRGQQPSVDLGVVAVTSALGAAPGAAVGVFAVGRAAGWIAHALEQRAAGFMVRPRARYLGP